jgi:hypothetical protein
LAIGAIAAHLGASIHDLEAQIDFHLAAHFLERLTKKFLDFSAAKADDVGVLLL